MNTKSWWQKLWHSHTWGKWQTTKEFRYVEWRPAFDAKPNVDYVGKYGKPVLDQRRTCEACGAVDLRRIYG
jgi:hypothetical protein